MSDANGRPSTTVRAPMRVSESGASLAGLLTRMRRSAFQGRKLGEAFEAWKHMIDGSSLVCLGLAGSLASAGLWPLVTWLVERGYVDLIASTCANITEDVLEVRGSTVHQVDPEHVDDAELWRTRRYRFYDHVVSATEYDAMETFTARFFRHLESSWKHASISGARFMLEYGRWLEAQGLGDCIAATCARENVPLFVPAAHDGPLSEGYRESGVRGPAVDFFRDYSIALELMERYMTPERGTAAVFLGGGVPKDFIQITATSVCAIRGGEKSPHRAAIQVTTDNPVYGGLGGASVASECISWGKEAEDGVNVMCFTDATIALPILCEALAEHYGPSHRRRVGRVEAALTEVLGP
jgi:deoxyhypusine synthase